MAIYTILSAQKSGSVRFVETQLITTCLLYAVPRVFMPKEQIVVFLLTCRKALGLVGWKDLVIFLQHFGFMQLVLKCFLWLHFINIDW